MKKIRNKTNGNVIISILLTAVLILIGLSLSVSSEDTGATEKVTKITHGEAVVQSGTKSRKEGETKWQSQTVRTDYDEQGQVIKEYTPRGTKENVATEYAYDC